MSDTRTQEMCAEHAASTKQLLEEIWAAVDAETTYEDSDPMEYLEEWPLEIVWEKGEAFAVVLGTGGPHVEINGGGREGGYKVAVYWAGEKAYQSGEAITRTGEYFREQMEEVG